MKRLSQNLIGSLLIFCFVVSCSEPTATPTPTEAVPTIGVVSLETVDSSASEILTLKKVLSIIQPERCHDIALIIYELESGDLSRWLCDGASVAAFSSDIEESFQLPTYWLNNYTQRSENVIVAEFEFLHEPCCERVVNHELVSLIAGEIETYTALRVDAVWMVEAEITGSIDGEISAVINLPRGEEDFDAPLHCLELEYQCNEFSSKRDAQTFFDACEVEGIKNPYNLDPDRDGIVCE